MIYNMESPLNEPDSNEPVQQGCTRYESKSAVYFHNWCVTQQHRLLLAVLRLKTNSMP